MEIFAMLMIAIIITLVTSLAYIGYLLFFFEPSYLIKRLIGSIFGKIGIFFSNSLLKSLFFVSIILVNLLISGTIKYFIKKGILGSFSTLGSPFNVIVVVCFILFGYYYRRSYNFIHLVENQIHELRSFAKIIYASVLGMIIFFLPSCANAARCKNIFFPQWITLEIIPCMFGVGMLFCTAIVHGKNSLNKIGNNYGLNVSRNEMQSDIVEKDLKYTKLYLDKYVSITEKINRGKLFLIPIKLKWYECVTKKIPNQKRYLTKVRCRYLFAKKHYAQCIKEIDQYLVNNLSHTLISLKALCMMEMGEKEEAIEIIETVHNYESNPKLMINLGYIYEKNNNYEMAEKIFKNLSEKNNASKLAHNNYAYMHMTRYMYGLVDSEMTYLEKKIECILKGAMPLEYRAQFLDTIGMYYMLNDNYVKAQKYYIEALKINDCVLSRFHLGIMHMIGSDYFIRSRYHFNKAYNQTKDIRLKNKIEISLKRIDMAIEDKFTFHEGILRGCLSNSDQVYNACVSEDIKSLRKIIKKKYNRRHK